jgi:hypothetical protein
MLNKYNLFTCWPSEGRTWVMVLVLIVAIKGIRKIIFKFDKTLDEDDKLFFL